MLTSTLLRLIRFSQAHSRAVIAVTLLATLALGWFALQIRTESDLLSLIPKDERMRQQVERYGQGQVKPEWMVVAVESDDPFTVERLGAFAGAIRRIESLRHVRASINPFNLFTFEWDGRKLEVVPMAAAGSPPRTAEEAASFRRRLAADSFARKFVISESGRMMAAFFPMDPVADPGRTMRDLEGILASLQGQFRTYVTGPVPFEHIARRYLVGDLPRLLILAAFFILLVYFIGFRSLRAVLLPFLVVVLGTVWSLGLMSLLGFTLSLVSIMTPPLVLTLGSSYSIHVLNQYYREARIGSTDNGWISNAVLHINQTIVLAALTTIAGFISLLATTLRQIREFGLSTSFGIAACALLALFFLPAALTHLRTPSAVQQRKILEGPIARIMGRLSLFVLRARVLLLLSLILVGVLFGFLFDSVRRQSDYMSYFPDREPAVQATQTVTRELGGFSTIYLTLSAPEGRKGYFLEPQTLRRVSGLEERLKSNPDIFYLLSFSSYLKELNRTMSGEAEIPENRGLILLLSRYFKAIARQGGETNPVGLLADEDFSRLTIALRFYDSRRQRLLFEAGLRRLLAQIESHIEQTLPAEIKSELWGTSFILLSLSDILNRNWIVSTLLSIGLILLINTLSFKAFRYGLFSLVPLLTGIMLNFIFMAVTRIPLDMTTAMFTNLVCGVGVDNAIHFIIQFRRQIAIFPDDLEKVLSQTMKITGRPILLTTASVVVGLLVLTFASFLPIRYFGILVALALLTTTAGSLIVLPAILSMGSRKERLRAVARARAKAPAGPPRVPAGEDGEVTAPKPGRLVENPPN